MFLGGRPWVVCVVVFAALVVAGVNAYAAEMVWEPQLDTPGSTLDPFSFSFTQGAVGHVGYSYASGGQVVHCYIGILANDKCSSSGPALQASIARSADGGIWYAEATGGGAVTWHAPDGRSGGFPSAGGDERIYPHDDGSAELSWYSQDTHDWHWAHVDPNQSGTPADAGAVSTKAGNFGRFWSACAGPSATLVFSVGPLGTMFVQAGFNAESKPLALPSGNDPRVFCQTLPDGVAFAYGATTSNGTGETITVSELDDAGVLQDALTTVVRPRDPTAASDRVETFAVLGAQYYLVARTRNTSASDPVYRASGSADGGATWSDWTTLTDPAPTDSLLAVVDDYRLAWLDRAGGARLWAYPRLIGEPPPPDSSLQATPTCGLKDAADGLSPEFECSGETRVKLPGSNQFVSLSPDQQLPSGTVLDASNSTVAVTVKALDGTIRSGRFSGAVFKILRPRLDRAEATLLLTGKLKCPARAGASRKPTPDAQQKQKRKQKNKKKTKPNAKSKNKPASRHSLWGDAHGGFTTQGRWLAATDIGTRWLTEDTCTGTTVRVTEGSVRVQNLKTLNFRDVRAGHSFTVRGDK